ncbi:ABC transporter ATP-binding protein [Serpentinicella alkaliphila]|uniref:Peptide/nickel transport system ATP-binding protein n=1 Tax=Serpentinicella alkaliphila TaxID=1734049 RepID=A0A4R2TCP5_9FIRM|nr:ABC transporter ATP-binding protein [Serpentinicella alkaliphila]QUH25762.1 ABC transporter ATP-binding protein [Serpentinicella alkaliphila]TCP99761.1 peptide/nickel transport system ATP-binding protein [Serpentinicella alkaliphila]
MSEVILDIRNLRVEYKTQDGSVKAVENLSFNLRKGETLGLVGETGAGKTTTALSIMQLVPNPPGKILEGQILFNGEDLLLKRTEEMRKIRGNKISMIFQDPMTSLNPVMPVGFQITESIALHQKLNKKEAAIKAEEMLDLVGIPKARAGEFPHQFSGGMRQRVGIAMALSCNPELLISDEPTTALDVTIQAQVLELMKKLKEQFKTSMLLITHDLGVVAEVCDKVAIMYAGKVVEFADVNALFTEPKHPYTKGLFGSIPSLDEEVDRLNPIRGTMPDPTNLPTGCTFHPRCPHTQEICKTREPDIVELEDGTKISCLIYQGLVATGK